MTPEAKVKRKVVDTLKRFNVYYFYPVTRGYGASGVPDIVACVAGQFVGIECKAGNNKPTALQKRNLEQIETAGGRTLVINEDNTDAVGDLIKTILTESFNGNSDSSSSR
jgi:hypothetical protein